MKICIAGATGLIGQALVEHYAAEQEVLIISRNPQQAKEFFPNQTCIPWERTQLLKTLSSTDVIINLAGENIGAQRWTKNTQHRIINSRVNTTQLICELCQHLPPEQRPRLLNASAIGIYGLQHNLMLQNTIIYSEASPPPTSPTDFLAQVGQAWEAPLNEAHGLSIVKLRFGVVLSPQGGMLSKLYLPFKLGFGGPIGSGLQPLSWIALEDAVRAIAFIVEQPELNGPINVVAPEILQQRMFARKFAKRLRRPSFMCLPTFMVKLMFGQMGNELLLSGQKVISERLSEFVFNYPTLDSALAHWQFK